ncbi:hypothetical protein [Paraglaciecola aestuariivivens]
MAILKYAGDYKPSPDERTIVGTKCLSTSIEGSNALPAKQTAKKSENNKVLSAEELISIMVDELNKETTARQTPQKDQQKKN